VLEKCGVLLQLVGHLINDKTAAGRECIVRFSQERAFLVDLENAERNARKNIVAASDAATFQLIWQRGCIAMDHMHARIACKLPFKCTRERRIELEQEQMRTRTHSSRNLARVYAFTRAVLRDDAWLTEIHFAGDAFHERFRAGNDRRDLKRPLQEALKKQNTHETRTVASRLRVVQWRSVYDR